VETSQNLLIFGASTRAAAFSALRAGLQPWCADLFADADLQACCPAMRVPADSYPRGFLTLAKESIPGPWMYTGALENWLLEEPEIAFIRLLWGIFGEELFLARSPMHVRSVLRAAGLPCPVVRASPEQVPTNGHWLVKRLNSSGGTGIRFWTEELAKKRRPERVYFQEHVEGQACSVIYVGDGKQTRLLGATRQLVGEDWLHAAPFHYCGSIGPLPLNAALSAKFERLGNVLAAGCKLRGLFGVDCVLRDGVPLLVEVNPRYTASVEVLEYATGTRALALHRSVFDPGYNSPHAYSLPHQKADAPRAPGFVGKAVVVAPDALVFPSEGPWMTTLSRPGLIDEMPAFADIPYPGEGIDRGRPILTCLARAESPAGCEQELRQIAQELDRWLFAR